MNVFSSSRTYGGDRWDALSAAAWGVAMGAEFYSKGANVQLGPGV